MRRQFAVLWLSVMCLVLVLAGCDASKGAASVTPTPTPKGAVPAAAILGGTAGAFRAKYGAPFRTVLAAAEFLAQSQWGPLDIGIVSNSRIGAQDTANDRVLSVTIGGIEVGNPPRWTLDDARAACDPFMPPDAVYERDVPPAVGVGTIKLYRSTLLANSLPARFFKDYQQHPMQPGEFEVGYQFYTSDARPTYDHAHYGWCVLSAGFTTQL